MSESKSLTIDWNRSIQIDSSIDDDLVRRLTPKILAMRQASNEPITIGIDSPGGSLASLDILLGLLTGRDQDGEPCQLITVATHRAYSAAANLLAFGDYAVALGHSQVLYHDVRYGGMEDVTPEKARDAAKSLQDANDAFALKLAHRIISRLVWVYIDLQGSFPDIRTRYQDSYNKYTKLVEVYVPKVAGYECIDLPSFATALWGRLSFRNDSLIKNVMGRLERWINFTAISKTAPTYRAKGSRVAGLLDGTRHLHGLLGGKIEHFAASEESLKLLLALITADISRTKTEKPNFQRVLDRAAREYSTLESMNNPKHIRYASNLMLRHKHIFFTGQLAGEIENMNEAEKAQLFAQAAPYARLLWHFCVLLCRELFEGEHILQPSDAQLLGLVDEVSGGGPIQSRREFWLEQEKRLAATTVAT